MEWTHWLALSGALLPGTLGFGTSRLLGLSAGTARRAAAAGALGAFGLALLCALLVALTGFDASSALASDGLGVYVDGLTCVMLLTVTLIGAVVVRYAVRYLDGDPGQARFVQWISYTLSAVLLMVVSSHLLLFFLGWVATSHGLHRLLSFYPERPAAVLAARKKFLISRLGDVMLLSAFALIYQTFGSLEFREILGRASELGAHGFASTAIPALLVLGAMTKSAQFPFHTWLPDTMETPTPVSALMHAGIINAGGFLLIRTSPLLVASPAAMGLLALGGAFTALLASVVMLSQTDVKRKYAYSTVSQMGFMMMQCGLGAFSAAALHLVGHSFYKGHAFLSANSAIEPDPPQPNAKAHEVRSPLARTLSTMAALACGVAAVGAALWLLDVDVASKAGMPVLGTILVFAVAQLVLLPASQTGDGWSSWPGRTAIGALLAVVYFVGIGALDAILPASVHEASMAALPTGTAGVALCALIASFFVASLVVQARLPGRNAGTFWRAAYLHAHNGFYLGAIQNRLVERVWPVRNDMTTAPATHGGSNAWN